MNNIKSYTEYTNENLKKKEDDPCWSGYVKLGTKKKGGSEVPNCVPLKETKEDIDTDILKKIRYYKGTVADFKTFWDNKAGVNTNSFDTPAYQGFENVHPVRGPKESPHWKECNLY